MPLLALLVCKMRNLDYSFVKVWKGLSIQTTTSRKMQKRQSKPQSISKGMEREVLNHFQAIIVGTDKSIIWEEVTTNPRVLRDNSRCIHSGKDYCGNSFINIFYLMYIFIFFTGNNNIFSRFQVPLSP